MERLAWPARKICFISSVDMCFQWNIFGWRNLLVNRAKYRQNHRQFQLSFHQELNPGGKIKADMEGMWVSRTIFSKTPLSSIPELLSLPHSWKSEFLIVGHLSQQNQWTRLWKKHYFILSNHELYFYKNRGTFARDIWPRHTFSTLNCDSFKCMTYSDSLSCKDDLEPVRNRPIDLEGYKIE